MNSYNEVRQALDPVVGVPFNELAASLRVPLPDDPRKRKAAGGDVVEALLQIAKNSIPRPDLEALGTEVKTLPLNSHSRTREWTKISAFNLAKTKSESDFRRSSVFTKLRSILFVPIMKSDNASPDLWYLRPPFLWLPTEDQLERFDIDYGAVHSAALEERWSELGSDVGEYLTLKTSDSRTKGKSPEAKRRAWWLKSTLTNEICLQNLWPTQAISQRKSGVAKPTSD